MNVNEVKRRCRNEFVTVLPTCVRVARLVGKSAADETAQRVDRERCEDLAVQLTVEVLRQCCMSSHSGNAVVRLVSAQRVSIIFFFDLGEG